jgi:hypothetical protein
MGLSRVSYGVSILWAAEASGRTLYSHNVTTFLTKPYVGKLRLGWTMLDAGMSADSAIPRIHYPQFICVLSGGEPPTRLPLGFTHLYNIYAASGSTTLRLASFLLCDSDYPS